ncbi:MAG: hypothetical protein JKX94_06570 [Sneathiella sp.]|nr:hypothetical protein [Sneathiella sp.]
MKKETPMTSGEEFVKSWTDNAKFLAETGCMILQKNMIAAVLVLSPP